MVGRFQSPLVYYHEHGSQYFTRYSYIIIKSLTQYAISIT